jgi:MazG family protein
VGSTREAVAEALLALDDVTRILRRECPWDREQDERSIVPHTVEEAYELADAAHEGDDAKLRDELGDVLFQVYFLSVLLDEREAGDLAQVARDVTAKLVRRHPHVFGEGSDALDRLPTEARTPEQVRENWDAIKRTETPDQHPLAGVPETLPSLLYARKLQRRALGGDDKVDAREALARLRAKLEAIAARPAEAPAGGSGPAHGSDAEYAEIGELLFSAVELARARRVDPELALRQAGRRFRDSSLRAAQA